MDRKGKNYLNKRAKKATLTGVTLIALFVVAIIIFFLSTNPNQMLTKQNESFGVIIDQTITDHSSSSTDESLRPLSTQLTEKTVEDSNLPVTRSDEVSDHVASEPDKEIKEIPCRIIMKQDEDYNTIPDKYNCGVHGNLTKVEASDIVNGIELKESGGINSFDFYYRNSDVNGELRFSNYDFSDHIVAVYSADKIDREITLVFENCRFSAFRSLSEYPKVDLVFSNCTFNSFSGSCAEFEYCKFGDGYNDGIVPFHDVIVNNCYFSNFASKDEAGTGVHTDGTQIYGKDGLNAENIRYEHCRFEVPYIPGTNSINACIMLQMEYSSGINILFDDCICNGGGYTIYASAKDKGFEYYENVVLSNIAVGQSKRYGSLYPTVADGVKISNIHDIDSLYVSSVWKENGNTHMSVTNDTLRERQLFVYADGVYYEYVIPSNRGGKTEYFDSFEDYPIDLDICINSDCRYVVCFDGTSGEEKQIRFETWDGSDSISIPWEE